MRSYRASIAGFRHIKTGKGERSDATSARRGLLRTGVLAAALALLAMLFTFGSDGRPVHAQSSDFLLDTNMTSATSGADTGYRTGGLGSIENANSPMTAPTTP